MRSFLFSSRFVVLVAAGLLFAGVISLTSVLIGLRPVPKQKEETVYKPEVVTQRIQRGSQAINVQVYGTVEPQNRVTLVAPFAGTAVATTDLYPGKTLEANEAIFLLEKVKLELAIAQIGTQIDELHLKEQQLKEDNELLRGRIENSQILLDIAEKTQAKQKDQLAIEKRLFSNIQELHEQESVSTTEFLVQESKLIKGEIGLFEAKTRVADVTNNLYRLRSELNSNEFALQNIVNQRALLQLKRDDLQNDLDKAEVSVDFPSQVSEVFIDSEEEVALGTKLIAVRSTDKVEVTVNIPDSYFKWLYAGDLLNDVAAGNSTKTLDIVLINQAFRKNFKGGYIKSVADRVNVPTRSLPVVIGRDNPRDEDGKLIATDELKPGMYCEVSIHLHDIDNVFLIQRKALQSENHIYHVVMNEKQEAELDIIQDVEILHESDAGVIVRLPEQYDELLLITHTMKRAWRGMPVEVVETE